MCADLLGSKGDCHGSAGKHQLHLCWHRIKERRIIFFSQKYLQWNWDFHSDALIIQRVDFIRLIHTELRKKAKRKYNDNMSPFNKELKSQGAHYLNFFSLPKDTFGLNQYHKSVFTDISSCVLLWYHSQLPAVDCHNVA